jgi:hypothetical protein
MTQLAQSLRLPIAIRLSDRAAGSLFLAFGALLVYLTMFDQGAALAAFIGSVSSEQNYLHELLHDGRHLNGAACH